MMKAIMKKLLLLLFAAAVVGCDELDPNSIIGSWDRYESKIETDYFNGVVYTYVEHTRYKFQKNGTCSMYKKGFKDEVLKSGTYNYNETVKTLRIKYDDNTSAIFGAELISGQLVLTRNGNKMIFEK